MTAIESLGEPAGRLLGVSGIDTVLVLALETVE
jgi:hypothetical protein